MERYILVYVIKDYPEMGGGTYFKSFKEEEDLHKEVNNLASSYKEIFKIVCAGVLAKTYEYEPVIQTLFYKPK